MKSSNVLDVINVNVSPYQNLKKKISKLNQQKDSKRNKWKIRDDFL